MWEGSWLMDKVPQIAEVLQGKKETLATAESCTGGLVGHLLTNASGSSEWYMGGMVAYSNMVKHGFLGVRRETLEREGAVSAEVAEQMAVGARQGFDTTYAVSVTGIAGPGGGTEEKPVGLTYIGVAGPERTVVRRFVWNGSRAANKQSSADAALALLLELLQETGENAPKESSMEGEASAAVDTAFEPDGKMRPLAFVWNGRSMKVTDWGRQWEKEGARYFLVMTAGDRIWELCFTPVTLHWHITPRTEERRTV